MQKQTLASANPPPRRKMTPQHIFVSISRQVIRDGAFFRLFFIELRDTCGRMKRRMDMKMAGVAEPTA